jgi:quercetin dioxygenase-like cupin family protein
MNDAKRIVQPAVEIDNELTRTVRWTLEPGTAIGHHRHLLPYIVIPVTGGTLTFSDADGDRAVELVPARPAFRPAGVEHDVSNRSDRPIVFVEVEIRDPRTS